MKTKITLILLPFLFLTTFKINPQIVATELPNKLTEIFRFNGITYSGDYVFGLHLNKEKAVQIATNLMEKGDYSGSHLKELKIYVENIEKKKGELLYEQFVKSNPLGYKTISREGFDKLTDIEKENLLGKRALFKEKN